MSLLDEDFLSVVAAAVKEGNERINELEESGQKLKSYDNWVTVKYGDDGWPSFSRSTFFSKGPVNYEACFAYVPNSFNGPILVDEIPAFVALFEYVRSHESVLRKLVPSPAVTEDHDFVRIASGGLATEIICRLRYMNQAPSDEAIRTLLKELLLPYEEEMLSVDVIVPLVLAKFEEGIDCVEVEEDLQLVRMDDDIQVCRVAGQHLPSSINEWVLEHATHAFIVSNQRVSVGHPWLRKSAYGDLSLSRIEDAITSVRLLSGVETGYAQVVLRPRGWSDGWRGALPPLVQAIRVRRYPGRFDYHGWLEERPAITVAEVGQLPTFVSALSRAPSNMRLAARRLSTAALREVPEDRILDACVGLEALAGDGSGELTYKLAMRISALLATDYDGNSFAPDAIYRLVKKVYAHRSAVAHGNAKSLEKTATVDLGDGTKVSTHLLAEMLLREALKRAIVNPAVANAEAMDQLLLKGLQKERSDS